MSIGLLKLTRLGDRLQGERNRFGAGSPNVANKLSLASDLASPPFCTYPCFSRALRSSLLSSPLFSTSLFSRSLSLPPSFSLSPSLSSPSISLHPALYLVTCLVPSSCSSISSLVPCCCLPRCLAHACLHGPHRTRSSEDKTGIASEKAIASAAAPGGCERDVRDSNTTFNNFHSFTKQL
jgi:hypothetical protein